MDHPPSDIDVDLSSDAASEAPIDEAEASQLLRSSKVYDFGSSAHATNPRRMEFSPTPSPPPPPQAQAAPAAPTSFPPQPHSQSAQQQQQQQQHAAQPPFSGSQASPVSAPISASYGGPEAGGSSSSSNAYAAPPASNGRDDHSEVGSTKDDTAENGATRNPSSPAVAGAPATTPSARSRTSIWVHFTRDPDYATNRRGRCVYCHNYYSCSSGSTGNMWRHIKRSHPEKAAQAAPLATHGTHTTPQSKAEGPFDSRPRKRQASQSSPVSERLTTPVRAVAQQQSQGQALQTPQQQSQVQQPSQAQQQQQRPLTDAVVRNIEEAVYSAAPLDADTTGADTLAHALRLLLTMTGRAHADRFTASQPQSSSATLLGLLDSLGASRSVSESDAAARSSRLSYRGNGGLPPIPEDRHAADHADGLADAGISAPVLRHSFGRQSLADPDGINQFVSAISDAIRANAETASGEDGSRRTLRAYVAFMVRDLVSVDKILSPGMQRLMTDVSRDAAVPTAAALVEEIGRQREARAQELRQRLDAVQGKVSVSISTGAISGTLHYLAVHAHWTDSAVVRHDDLLDCHCVDGAPTSGDIISAFEGTLTRYGLFGRLGAVTTNYTREFVEFLNQVETICHARGASFDLDRNQSTCIASTLLDAQTKLLGLLEGGVNLQQPMPAMGGAGAMAGSQAGAAGNPTPLVKLRNALHVLLGPNAGPASQQLVELCRSRSIDLGSLVFDSSRAWDSTVKVLDSALHIYADLSAIFSNAPAAAGNVLSPEDWLWLSQARALIQVVNVAITSLVRLPSDFPSIVDVVPVYDILGDNLQALLQTPTLCEGVRRAGETIRDYLAQCHPFQASPIYRLAPLFDPRLKTAYYADRGHDQAWTNRIMREASTLLAEYAEPGASSASSSGGNSGDTSVFAQAVASGQSGDIRAAIDSFIQLSSPAVASHLVADGKSRVFGRAYASGRTELDDYLNAPLAAAGVSAGPWWQLHCTAFPSLTKLVQEYLSISATCAPMPTFFQRESLPDYSQIAAMDRKLIDSYLCLHQWQKTRQEAPPGL
ncbi:hypothetical protein GGF46_003346 [Coemansia sp. RSA 552]|nr:hypothetical protein GGF46_003346 [Coemansia sp. RSA 552]